jgi:hypothetical protein
MGINEECGFVILFAPMLGKVEGCVEFFPEDSVGLRGVDGGDGRVVCER